MTHKTCSISGCDGKLVARGWCYKHYQRWRRHGDPTETKTLTPIGEQLYHLQSVVEWVRQTGDQSCFEWPYKRTEHGYGRLCYRGRNVGSHRLALALYEEIELPPPWVFCRHGPCHNPACFNPLHMCWGTAMENSNDRQRDGTARRKEPS